MSEVRDELGRVREAYRQPTLRLLHKSSAPVIVAIFRACFDDKTTARDSTWLEQAVEDHLSTLRARGESDVPSGTAHDLCRSWMKTRWLERTQEEGREVYQLTSHAQSALQLVRSISSDHSGLSEHRIATIISAARRFNSRTNPDVGERVRILEDEIARLQAERTALLDSESEVAEVSDDYLIEGFSELMDLVGSLPRDFTRTQEAVEAMGADLTTRFQAGEQSAGELVHEYLTRSEALMTGTPEGRAFEGALTLLNDPVLFAQLRGDLADLLRHPRSSEILLPKDQAQLRATIEVIRRGISAVVARRTRVTSRVRDYITTHDLAHERRLDQVLMQLEAAFPAWLEATGPRTPSPAQLPQRPDLQSLPTKFWEPGEDRAPEELTVAEDTGPAPSLAELAAGGGPSMARLAAALSDTTGPDLAAMFNDLDADLRRPVEIAGLLHMAHNNPALDVVDGQHDIYLARRPDGSRRTVQAPRVTITPEETQ